MQLNNRIHLLPKFKKAGLLKIESGRTLQNHEIATINKLLQFGYDIFCQAEANLPYIKVADIIWCNEQWEIKSTKAKGKNTVAHRLQAGKRQSKNIILDVSESNKPIERLIGQVKIGMCRSKTIKKVLVLYKNEYCIIDKSTI